MLLTGLLTTSSAALGCGGVNESACDFTHYRAPCDEGLTEIFAPGCLAENTPPCQGLAISWCSESGIECGGKDQSACDVFIQIVDNRSGCDAGLVEIFAPACGVGSAPDCRGVATTWCTETAKAGENCGLFDNGVPCEDGLVCRLVGVGENRCYPDLDGVVSPEQCLSFYSPEVMGLAMGSRDIATGGKGQTMSFGYGGAAAAIVGTSQERGVAYGRDGCFSCYETQCDGVETGIGVEGFATAGRASTPVRCIGDNICSNRPQQACSTSSDCPAGGRCEPCSTFDGASVDMTVGVGTPLANFGISHTWSFAGCPEVDLASLVPGSEGNIANYPECQRVASGETFSYGVGVSTVIEASFASCTTVQTVAGCVANGDITAAEVEIPISQGKTASQGSTYGEANASRAVDGNTDGTWSAGSVAHTNNDAATNWWLLDLGVESEIDSIEVFNRTDCCSHRLNGARVYVGSVPYNGSLADFVEVASLDARDQQTYDLGRSFGRYLLIKGAGSEYLQLAEVKVFGTESPPVRLISQGKSASQGSTAHEGNASRAVDGNTDGNWGAGSVTHTDYDAATNWWQLDLGAQSEIDSIEVFNRTDWGSERLNGARVYVGSVPYNGSLADFVEVASLDARNQQTYDLAQSIGRYVLIKGAGSEPLSLAEVKVFGTEAPTVVLISQGRSASQGSTAYGGNASRAVDGNINGSWTAGSVTHTDYDAATNWWQLDLGAEKEIDSIDVFNRTDCCGHRLNGARVYVGSVPYNGSLAGFVHVASLDARNQQTYDLARSIGRYVLIKGAGSEPLSLAEVEVFGTELPIVRAYLRTSNGHYITASGGGGGTVGANRTWGQAWESFTLIDHNGGSLMSGDKVNLMAYDGVHYMAAESGGGREVAADKPWAGPHETFTIRKATGAGPIRYGDSVTLQAQNGHYVVAEGGGGGVVNANRPQVGPWEQFTLLNAP